MSEGARIRSVEALRPFRAAILVFARDVASILSAAEAEIAKTIDWLQRDRVTYWRAETQRRGEMLARAKSDLYRAQIQKKSLVDEKKAIGRAKEALRDAEERLEASRKWAVRLEHDRALYAGAVQGLSVSVSIDLPKAAAMLELMSRSLDEYVALSASWMEGTLDDSPGTVRQAMSRGGSGGGGMPVEAEVVAAIRAMLPGLLEREAAPSIESADVSLGARRVTEVVGDAVIEGEMPDDRLRVVIDARVIREDLLFLVRDGDALPGDSGWFVAGAPTLHGEPRLVSATIGHVREAWPDLEAYWCAGTEMVIAVEGERVRVLRAIADGSGTIRDQPEEDASS